MSVLYKHFYTKESYDNFLNTSIDEFFKILEDVKEEKSLDDLPPDIQDAISRDQNKVPIFFIKITEHFRREFSFEKQFVNLLHSDTFFTEVYPGHYKTMVPKYKFDNPFPDKDSNLGAEAQLQSDEQLIIQKKNVEEAYKSSQIALGNEDPPSPTLINSYHSISFTRLHGRKDNNYSYVEKNHEGQSKSPFSKINSIINELKKTNKLNDQELALAIFLSKKFGGIGTKFQQILQYYGKQLPAVKTYLENNSSEILRKMITFSSQFQKECKLQGIYSGNEKLADDKKKEYGLRLSFIPDEIFRLHLNKLPHDSITKKFIIGQIKTSQASRD
jgi:hypothetical protein